VKVEVTAGKVVNAQYVSHLLIHMKVLNAGGVVITSTADAWVKQACHVRCGLVPRAAERPN
jgi:hypothetical protein